MKLFILIFVLAFHAEASTILSCGHKELCQMAKRIATFSKLDLKMQTLVTISGDPHEFEPSTEEIKKLISAPLLLSGPAELNPWIKKIHYQRTKAGQKTIQLLLSENDLKAYPMAKAEAVSHFWLYPKIYCSFQAKLEEELSSLGLKIIHQNCSLEIEPQLKMALGKIKFPIILTHDALLPLLETLAGKNTIITAIKGSGHHEEVNPLAIKKMYQALNAKKVIWIKEKGINIPSNILNKMRTTDEIIEIDTAATLENNPSSVLLELVTKLEALK